MAPAVSSASPPDASEVASLRAAYVAAGQGHVFAHWDACDDAERSALIDQLRVIGDVARVASTFARSVADHDAGNSSKGAIEPVRADASSTDPDHAPRWRDLGLRAAAKGELAVVLLAGGQGTRLGSSDPKGMYDVGLPSGRSLFRLQAERLKKLAELAGARGSDESPTKPSADDPPPASIPLYVMTSPFTHDATVAYFETHGHFGLAPSDVVFFKQGWLPCFTFDGKIIMASKSAVATAPDGNGGVYAALRENGCIADMRRRGVKHVHAYCVDNALVRPGDPTFVGFCAEKGAEAGAKVIAKAYPEEPVGVFTTRGGKVHVVEYSEMPADLAAEKDASGELKFDAANVVLHYYAFEFLARCCDETGALASELAYHVAKKKIPHCDPGGDPETQVAPKSPNGIKLEAFIFDAYAFAKGPVAFLRGVREEDFAPVKNAEGSGKDSPDTARKLVSDLHARWIERAGGRVEGDAETELIEVAPDASCEGEGLERLCGGRTFARGSCVDKRESDEGGKADKRKLAEDDEGAQDAKKQKP